VREDSLALRETSRLIPSEEAAEETAFRANNIAQGLKPAYILRLYGTAESRALTRFLF
jgi:hypothetical protein